MIRTILNYKFQYFYMTNSINVIIISIGLQMFEDEQILLSNLSPTHQSQKSHSKSEQQLLLQLHQQQSTHKNIITEIYKQRQYKIDWNKGENHQYFTKIINEDIKQLQCTHQQTIKCKQNKNNYQYYQGLAQKLEIALNRIHQNNQIKNSKKIQIRSQSIQGHKQRQIMMFSTTGREFRTEYTNEKKIANSRTKTETEQSEKEKSKGINGKIEKYKMNHIITEQKQHSNIKECSKENNLKTKFLASIALWQQKKEKKQQQRIEKQKKITMEGVTFTPQINARSRQIMKKKGTIAPIYQRQRREGQQKKRELTERFNADYKVNRVKY